MLDGFTKDYGAPEEGSVEYERFEHLMELPPPECYRWVYHQFIALHNLSDAVVTPATIREYEALYQIRFKLAEIDLLFAMKSWANDEIRKLEKGVTDE